MFIIVLLLRSLFGVENLSFFTAFIGDPVGVLSCSSVCKRILREVASSILFEFGESFSKDRRKIKILLLCLFQVIVRVHQPSADEVEDVSGFKFIISFGTCIKLFASSNDVINRDSLFELVLDLSTSFTIFDAVAALGKVQFDVIAESCTKVRAGLP